MKRFNFNIVIVIGALLLAACAVQEGTEQAEFETARFHTLYNKGDFDEIYRRSHDDFKGFVSAGQLRELLSKLRRTLGDHQSSELITWSVRTSFTGKGTKITLVFSAEYDFSRQVKETFTFHKRGADIRLYNFNVSAPDFARPENSKRKKTTDI